MTERQREIIARHLAALDDDAKAMDATADLFRPEFEACWDHSPDGKMSGPIRDSERAMQLRGLVLEGASNAKYNRELAGAIRALMGE